MKTFLRNIINLAGYDIKKLPSKNIESRYKTGKPLKIEFVGPSGIGKTTLYKELIKLRTKRDKWLSADEFIQHHTKLKNNHYISEPFAELLELKTKRVLLGKKDHSIFRKMGLLSYFYKILKKDLIFKRYNKDFKIIMDEGVVHNFTNEFIDLSKDKPEYFRMLIQDVAIVFFNSSEEFITYNSLKRAKEKG